MTSANSFFDFVTDRVATGGAISNSGDVQLLVNAGINVVVDARDEFNDGPLLAGTPGIQYLWNPTDDDGESKPVDYWQRTLSFVMPLLAQPHSKVYLHCAAGVHRGPCNTFAVLVASGFAPDLAAQLIIAARPQAQIIYRDSVLAAISQLGY